MGEEDEDNSIKGFLHETGGNALLQTLLQILMTELEGDRSAHKDDIVNRSVSRTSLSSSKKRPINRPIIKLACKILFRIKAQSASEGELDQHPSTVNFVPDSLREIDFFVTTLQRILAFNDQDVNLPL